MWQGPGPAKVPDFPPEIIRKTGRFPTITIGGGHAGADRRTGLRIPASRAALPVVSNAENQFRIVRRTFLNGTFLNQHIENFMNPIFNPFDADSVR